MHLKLNVLKFSHDILKFIKKFATNTAMSWKPSKSSVLASLMLFVKICG